MEEKQTGNTMLYASIGLLAGVVGSVLTLLVAANQNSESGPELRRDTAVASGFMANVESKNLDLDHSKNSLNSGQPVDPNFQEVMQLASVERQQLADALADLTQKIDDLESDMINQVSMNTLLPGTPESDADEAQIQPGTQRGDGSRFGREATAENRLNGLVAAGVSLQVAQEIQSRQDRFQLDRLELFDQAEREGWIESDDFSDRLEQLDEQRLDLRDELGDAAYDRYLFELGRSNRVAISSVIGGSAADLAGLQSGDTVFSYANQRVFTTRELQSATRQGSRGEFVNMQLLRNGNILTAEIPRGPLGVTLTATRSEPS